MFVSTPPQNSYVESPNPQSDGIWRWRLWEEIGLDEVVMVRALHDGISALVREGTRELDLSLSAM